MASAQVNDFNRQAGGVGPTGEPKRRCESYGPESVDSWAITEKVEQEFSFLWKLEEFSTMVGRKELKSPVFLENAPAQHKWQLKVNPKNNIDGAEFFGLNLILTDFGKGHDPTVEKINAKFEFSILNSEGNPLFKHGGATMAPREFKKNTSWGFSKMIPASDLLYTCVPHRVLINDAITILVKVWIEGGVKHEVGCPEEEKLEAKHHSNKEKLVKDLKNMFTTGVASDFDIIGNYTTFHVHKFVLAARSPFFERMFKARPNEEPVKEMRMEYSDASVKNMLDFIYTGEVIEPIEPIDLLKYDALELFNLAHNYDVQSLQEACEEVLLDNIRVGNATDILISAHSNNANELKSRAIKFINWNKKAVQGTVTFPQFIKCHPHLVTELYMAQE
ncbi:unnamed protein product [Orchesella dallaii]|uniref:BTB domain-containing protein n=1 Tax=Orchesella dallaii TaxID=48710 RepID=A0ABP1R0S4_9HEXA